MALAARSLWNEITGSMNPMSGHISAGRVERTMVILSMMAVLIVAPLSAQSGEEMVKKSLPCLYGKISTLDQGVYPAFLEYAASVLKPDWIKADDDLSLLFKKRESILITLIGSEPLYDFLFKEAERWQFKDKSGDWEEYVRELGLIGIRAVFAEGMFTGFTEGPVLEELISRVASGPFQLYARLVEAYARSYGGEYTYMDLGPEMEAIEIAERLMELYPESKYTELAKPILAKALFPLTDWHIMFLADASSGGKDKDGPFCIVGELHTRPFPFLTDISEPNKFLEAYPGSGFSAAIARIVTDPSEIMLGKSVHTVVVDEFRDEESARGAILSYLLKGVDIPHLITLSETSFIVAYRFFSDPEKAQKALERIKTIKPDAAIRELHPPDDSAI